MEIRVLLVESNELIRGELWNRLAMYRTFRLAGAVDTAEQAIDFVAAHEVDVVFANRQPADPRITSEASHLGLILFQDHPDIQLVVYSEERDYAYHACRAQCAGFLLYPFDSLDLQMLVNRLTYIHDLQQIKRETAERSIMVKTRSGYQLTRIQDILFVEHINRSNRIVAEDGRVIELMGYTMNALEKLLEPRGFFRCHQSFIVNLSKVSAVHADNEVKRYTVSFRDYDGEILVSREKYAAMVSLLREKFARISG